MTYKRADQYTQKELANMDAGQACAWMAQADYERESDEWDRKWEAEKRRNESLAALTGIKDSVNGLWWLVLIVILIMAGVIH